MNLTDQEIELANCKDMNDDDIFFVDETDRNNRKAVQKAKAICSTCPIRLKCLQIALENDELGIWGGTTETDRRRLRRAMNRKVIPVLPRATFEAGLRANMDRSRRVAIQLSSDLEKLDSKIVENLPEDVQKLITLRMENPTISLTDLGELMSPVMTKNQVAGKLRRALAKAENG